MATVHEGPGGIQIELEHNEITGFIGAITGGTAATVTAMVAWGMAATTAGYISAAIALHIAWETAAIELSDKGDGVILSAPASIWLTGGAGIVIPSTRHARSIPDTWVTDQHGEFHSQGGDVVEFHVTHDGDPQVVTFRMRVHCPSGWDKAFTMPDGEGNQWWVQGSESQQGENSLWPQQVHNGQELTFYKPGFLGQWQRVFPVGNLDLLKAGDVATFVWTVD